MRPVLVLALAALLGGPAFADDAAGRAPMPNIPKAEGEHCVRDTAFMRRYHMVMLLTQRDDTMHQGLRGGDFSIARCVTCHAVKGDDGEPVAYSDPRHFCRSCHSYAAVSIDCFECHASRPQQTTKAADANGAGDPALAALGAYLGEVSR